MCAIELVVLKFSPLFMCCTETHVRSEVDDNELQVDHYKAVRSNSISSHTVVVFIHEKVQYKLVNDYAFDFNYVLVIDVTNTNVRGRWFLIYHSPNTSQTEFLDKLEDVLNVNSDTSLNMKMTGDFNINVSTEVNASYKQRLLSFANCYGMRQKVDQYTRVDRQSRSTISPLLY